MEDDPHCARGKDRAKIAHLVRIVRIIDKREINGHHRLGKLVDPVTSSAVHHGKVWMTTQTKGMIFITTTNDHDTHERVGTIE